MGEPVIVADRQIGIDSRALTLQRAMHFGIQTPQEGTTFEALAAAWGMSPKQMADRALAGTPEQVIDRIHAYREAGVTGFIGMYGRVEDLRSTRMVAERVLPSFR